MGILSIFPLIVGKSKTTDFVLDKWVDARQNIPNLWSGMAEVTDSQCQVKMALSLLELTVHNIMTVALFLLLP